MLAVVEAVNQQLYLILQQIALCSVVSNVLQHCLMSVMLIARTCSGADY